MTYKIYEFKSEKLEKGKKNPLLYLHYKENKKNRFMQTQK